MWAFFLVISGLYGAMAVVAGAYATHEMATGMGPAQDFVHLTSGYQLIHAVALLGIATMKDRLNGLPQRLVLLAGAFLTVGVLLFCGALYALGLFNARPMPMAAPTGGMLLIGGWLLLALAGLLVAFKQRRI